MPSHPKRQKHSPLTQGMLPDYTDLSTYVRRHL